MGNRVMTPVETDEPAPGSSEWLGAEIDRMFRRSTRWMVGAILGFGLVLDVASTSSSPVADTTRPPPRSGADAASQPYGCSRGNTP